MRLLFLLLAVAACLSAADDGRIFYSKSFPGSTPAYVAITVAKDGQLVYREAPDDDHPQQLQLTPDETADIFRLADKLDRFKRPLESNLKVAQMGLKTFRYEQGGTRNEVKFNYSLDESAKELADWFERIIESEQRFFDLDRAVHFDKLGVNQAVLNLQTSWEHKRLVAVSQYLPLLDRISKNESFLHIARERALALAAMMRGDKVASK